MTPLLARFLLASTSMLMLATAPDHAAASYHNQGFSPGIDGFNPHETAINASNVQNLTLAWQSNTTDINGVYGMVEDKGTIFVESNDQNGTADIVAINGSNGSELWKASLNTTYAIFNGLTGIAAGQGQVFAPCVETTVPEGLCAFSEKTGKLAWSDSFYVQGFADGGPFGRSTYANGVVYVSESMCDSEQPTCDDFWAIDARTGAVIWGAHATANEYDGSLINLSPAISTSGGVMYVPCQYLFNGNNGDRFTGVCTFSTSNGTAGWQAGAEDQNPIYELDAAVSVSGTTTFFQQTEVNNNADFLTAFDASSGTSLWTFDAVAGRHDLVQPTVAKGAVYWPDGNGTLWSLKEKTGATRWSFDNWGSDCSPVNGPNGTESQPQVADGVVYIMTSCSSLGANSTSIFALAASNGAFLWQGSECCAGPASGAAPMIVNGTLYDDCTQVCAFALPGGSVRRQ